jgi:selenide, water dikinase
LGRILASLPGINDPAVLVGTEDDAGVYRINDDIALVQTVDFFTPIVDDPYDFGAIAAANALSDIYAMAARPLTALNLVAFPKDGPMDVLSEIIRGGADKAREAGVSIIGGHSIDDKEPKYGMAVTGVVHPKKMALKGGARPGDRLVLTKPLGTGIISTAIKVGKAPDALIAAAVRNMKSLNKAAAEAMIEAEVRCATDITGFGLLGHLHEILHVSGVSARLSFTRTPCMDGVPELVRLYVPAGTRSNLRYVDDKVRWAGDITENEKLVLADAQTSGGLLIAVAPEKLEQLLTGLEARAVAPCAVIGEITAGDAGNIFVEK